MINLMPPSVREQIRYARYNRIALRYLQLVVLIIVAVAAIFVAAIIYLGHLNAIVERDLESKKQTIAGYASDKAKATDAASRLATIKSIAASQTRFSQLLYDLAAVLPKGVSISGIALTGDSSKPVVVSVSGSTYDSILGFRDAIVTSPRIAGADLQSITSTATGYEANVVIGFKPGQAR
jgi:Tfp pilus assembly protein PilN